MVENQNSTEDYLSYANTKCIKGICAVGILIHHLFQYSRIEVNPILGMAFQSMGELLVAIFFFFSGYGLITSYIRKGKKYINKMPRNRMLTFYITCIFMEIIYILFYIIIGKFDILSIRVIIQTLLFGKTIIKLGWYLQTQLVLYLIFYAIFKFCQNNKYRSILLSIGWITYCLVCICMNLSITWYVSSITFLLGIFWGYNQEKIDKILNNKREFLISISSSFIIFILCFILSKILPNYISIILNIIYNLSFVVLMLNIVFAINKKKAKKIIFNKLTSYLGKISFEIYVSQGIFLILYRDKLVIENSYIYCCAVIICTVIFANILHVIFDKVNFLIKGKE